MWMQTDRGQPANLIIRSRYLREAVFTKPVALWTWNQSHFCPSTGAPLDSNKNKTDQKNRELWMQTHERTLVLWMWKINWVNSDVTDPSWFMNKRIVTNTKYFSDISVIFECNTVTFLQTASIKIPNWRRMRFIYKFSTYNIVKGRT